LISAIPSLTAATSSLLVLVWGKSSREANTACWRLKSSESWSMSAGGSSDELLAVDGPAEAEVSFLAEYMVRVA
jgi:hypothetical protein